MRKKQDTYFFKILALAVLFCFIVSLVTFCGKKEEPVELPPETTVPTEPVVIEPVVVKPLHEQMIEQAAAYYGVDADDYPQALVDLLGRNPETRAFVLAYPEEKNKIHTVDMSEYKDTDGVPLFMQWDQRWGYNTYGENIAALNGCGPVSLSMVAYYYTRDDSMSPDNMLRYAYDNKYCVPGSGTAWALISKGAKNLGFGVKELIPVKKTVMRELEAGHPIIAIMGPGDFTTIGHYIVFTGTENGLIRVNDCNSYANSAKLWEFEQIESQIRNMWAISYEPAEPTETTAPTQQLTP